MTSLQTPTVRVGDSDSDQIRSSVLAQGDADTYAQWFACLAGPMRVRLLHRVASAVGGITVGALAEALGIGAADGVASPAQARRCGFCDHA